MTHIQMNEVSARMASEEFGEKLNQHRKTLMAFFRRRNFRPEECEDLTQDTMTLGLQKQDNYEEEGNMQAWLLTLAKSKISSLQRYNHAKKRQRVTVPLSEATLETDLQKILDQSETQDPALAKRLWACVERLPPELNHALVLRLQGHTLEDCALLLQTKIGVVNRRYKKALKHLAEEWHA
ncbi:RNA polymerase sigma factor [Acanthopleuribacter pedis]|uniref:RNA polymerase sigma factor n=1 Tax=Acanthopleuribacter pedis TaxID=442870 RepID=A0A8J7Q8C6_9BACT|nr:RNA polymerase sigma factor [Acanthopleuribacter pedis]MBO1320326.1 RNA polymerase sigma factor [Acanthopleuribacter pedis]